MGSQAAAQKFAETSASKQRNAEEPANVLAPYDAALHHKLGKAARVYAALLSTRDAQGKTHATIAGLAKLSGLKQHSVRFGLIRLKLISLVQDIGFQVTRVRHDRATAPSVTGNVREVYVRRVRGGFCLKDDVWHLSAPPLVLVALKNTTGRGGKRAGAGRPRANQTALVGAQFDYPEAPEKTEEIIKPLDRIETSTEAIVFLPSEETPAAARRLVTWEEGMDGLPLVSDDAGCSLEGGGRPARLSEDGWTSMPPFPGVSVVQPATIPAPPKIEAAMSPEERIEMLRDAYNTACRRALPDEYNPYATKQLPERDTKALLAGAEALCSEDVSPLRWAEFAVDMWQNGREKDDKKRSERPGPKWIFAAGLIAQHAGWARTDREHRGARVIVTRSHRALLDRYAFMLSAVLRGEVAPADAEARFFPDGAYPRLVAKAKEEARREQAEINRRVQSGEYLWD